MCNCLLCWKRQFQRLKWWIAVYGFIFQWYLRRKQIWQDQRLIWHNLHVDCKTEFPVSISIGQHFGLCLLCVQAWLFLGQVWNSSIYLKQKVCPCALIPFQSKSTNLGIKKLCTPIGGECSTATPHMPQCKQNSIFHGSICRMAVDVVGNPVSAKG